MFPSNEIQQLDSYKEFQSWMSNRYSAKQITYIEKGFEPEKCGRSAQLMDYNSNNINIVSDIIFEYLPFAFQKGVFEEYFLSLDLYLNNYPIDIKEKIIYTFQQLDKI